MTYEGPKLTPGQIKSAFAQLMANQRWSKLTKAQRKASVEKSWVKRKINHPPKKNNP